METDWCLTCGRQTCDDSKVYCSHKCMVLDRRSVVCSLPIHVSSHRPSFDLPTMTPPQRTSYTRSNTRRETRARTSDGFSKKTPYNKARFRDEELQESRSSTFATSRWTGKDREGILVWAHAVYRGIEEDCESSVVEASSMSDLDRFLTRPRPFPLTAQNLAPPYVTILPRHALLNHTSIHYTSHLEDRTAPSLSQDDASLLTPATDSVITPSEPCKTDNATAKSPKSKPGLGSLIYKVCSWIVSSPRDPRTSPEGNPTPPFADDCLAAHADDGASCSLSPYYGDKSTAEAPLSLTSPTDTRPRMALLGGDPYE